MGDRPCMKGALLYRRRFLVPRLSKQFRDRDAESGQDDLSADRR